MPETGDFKNHPGVAAIMSFLFVGLGQLYNGQLSKGLVLIFCSAVSMVILIFGGVLMAYFFLGKLISLKVFLLGFGVFLTGLISICLFGVYSINDAYRAASKK